MNNKLKVRLFSIFSIMLLCVSFTIKYFRNDTFYIIKLGGDILNNGIDFVDHYSWVANLSYTYPHWLYDLIMYLVYSNFDFLGVYISVIICFIILILSVYIINLKMNKNEFMAMIVAVVTIPCLVAFASARAQLVTGILFLWQVYFIEKLILSGQKKYVFFLSLISLLVANLHATIWIFYFILFLPFIAEHFIYKLFFSKKDAKFKNFKLIIGEVSNFKFLLRSMILGFFMGLLSPSKICFTYIFRVMLGNSQNYILEHAPMVLIHHLPFLIFIIIPLIILIFSDTKIKLSELFMIGGLIFMSLSSARHGALFYIIGLLYVSVLGNRYLTNKNDLTLDYLTNLFVKNKFIYLSGFVFIMLIASVKFYNNFSFDYVPKEEYPVDAVDFINDNLDVSEIKLYNDYNVGSYLLFNNIPVFIDSRCDLYLKEFNGLEYSIFDDAVNMEYNYEKKFDFYDVTHVLLSNDSMFCKVLLVDSNYKVLYRDKYFTLFEVDYVENQ